MLQAEHSRNADHCRTAYLCLVPASYVVAHSILLMRVSGVVRAVCPSVVCVTLACADKCTDYCTLETRAEPYGTVVGVSRVRSVPYVRPVHAVLDHVRGIGHRGFRCGLPFCLRIHAAGTCPCAGELETPARRLLRLCRVRRDPETGLVSCVSLSS